MKLKKPNQLVFVSPIVSILLAALAPVHAADIYWDGASASWNTTSSWSTVNGATTPDPVAVPGALDNAIFNISSGGNSVRLVSMSADQSARSITFNNTTGGVINLVGGGAQQTLTLGIGGITMASGSGAILVGNSDALANRVLFSLTSGAQTWTNNSSSNFTLANGAATFTRATGSTLNFNKVGTGSFAIKTTEMPLVNSIVGNWAFNGTGTNMRYATIASNLVASASGTNATADAWTSATTNYAPTALFVVGLTANRTANTVLITVAGTTTLDANTAGVTNLTLNGILATASSGTFTLQRSGSGASSVIIGTTNELVIAGQQNVTFNQMAITGASGALTYSGTGTLTLAAGNADAVSTYGGGTTVNSGTFFLSGALASLGSTSGALTVNGGILNTGVSLAVGNLTGVGGTIQAASGARTLTIGTGNGTGGNYQGAIIDGAGTLALTKTGNGTITLSGTNTYTGATNVTGGTLIVEGSISTSSLTTIASNATLGGGGTVGALSFDGASFFDLSLAVVGNSLDAATISFATAGFGIDNLVFNGSAIDWGTVSNGTYTLINGTLNSTNLGNFGLGNAYDIGGSRSAYFQSGSLQLVVIPEPSTALLGSLGLIALLRRRR